MPPKGFKTITIKEEVYNELKAIYRDSGFYSFSDFLLYLAKIARLLNYRNIYGSGYGNNYGNIYGSEGETTVNTTVKYTVSNYRNSYRKNYGNITSESRKQRKTMLDVIRERKVQFLSEVRPRNPDRFLAKAKEYGIEVIEGNKDIALADPGFYKVFMEKLHNLNTSNEEKIKKLLDQNEYKLFKFLMENGLIYYDRINSRWKPV